MSTMTAIEKRRFEKLLDMSSGYLLHFSNSALYDFVLDETGRELYRDGDPYGTGSKASRMREFWRKEPDHIVARLLGALLECVRVERGSSTDFIECSRIVERLRQSAPVQDLSALEPNADGRDFEALAKAARESIERNKPEEGLDRLHTFVVKYVRVLCQENGIETPRDKPLHSLFGEYLKSLRLRGLVESDMGDRILRSTISTLDAFNDVRNNRSLAHDNPLLSHGEALLIFNHVASSIRFLSSIETQAKVEAAKTPSIDEDVPW